jgi:hypothetical protein
MHGCGNNARMRWQQTKLVFDRIIRASYMLINVAGAQGGSADGTIAMLHACKGLDGSSF